MATGYVSIHRELHDHWVWKDKPFSKGQAWIDLIMLANHTDSKFLLGNQLVEAKRGEIITSELKLMDRWGWSKTKVRAFLKLLESESMLIKNSDEKKTALTICNYCDWQDSKTAKEPQKDREETAKEPQKDTINNVNNSNNSNNENNDLEIPLSTRDRIDYAAITDLYHLLCPSLPRIEKMTDARKKAIKSAEKNYGHEIFESLFLRAEQSDFLTGRSGLWSCGFDWILKPANLVKIIEGNYDNKLSASVHQKTAQSKSKFDESIDVMQEWLKKREALNE